MKTQKMDQFLDFREVVIPEDRQMQLKGGFIVEDEIGGFIVEEDAEGF